MYPYSEFEIAELDVQERILQSLSNETIKTILKSFNLILSNDTQVSILRRRIADIFSRLAQHMSEDYITAVAQGIAIDNDLKLTLLIIVKCSANFLKDMPDIKLRASRAITILNKAKISFAKMDFSGVQIPGADLSYGNFAETNFEGANLSAVNFRNACLNGTNFNNMIIIRDDIKKFTPLFSFSIFEHERETDKTNKEIEDCVIKSNQQENHRKKPRIN